MKYRIYDKIDKYYVEEPDYRWMLSRSGKLYNSENDEWCIPESRYIIEFFTGLTDKNGKDIFEGDILSHKDNRNRYYSEYWEVIFYSGAFFMSGLPRKIRIYNMGDRLDSIEVIGNVHDNPELL